VPHSTLLLAANNVANRLLPTTNGYFFANADLWVRAVVTVNSTWASFDRPVTLSAGERSRQTAPILPASGLELPSGGSVHVDERANALCVAWLPLDRLPSATTPDLNALTVGTVTRRVTTDNDNTQLSVTGATRSR